MLSAALIGTYVLLLSTACVTSFQFHASKVRDTKRFLINEVLHLDANALSYAVDHSILGLLVQSNDINKWLSTNMVPENVVSAINNLPMHIDTNAFMNFIDNNDYLKALDIGKLPLLPPEVKNNLNENLNELQRILIGFLGLDVGAVTFDALILKYFVGNLISASRKGADPTGLPRSYDSEKIAQFYENRPQLVFGRFLELLDLSKDFLIGLLSDRNSGEQEKNAPLRAKQLRELISNLGPAFIKVGQAISVRPDLLSPTYLEELVKLQDKVPPFDSSIALDILQKELGRDPAEFFEDVEISFRSPVAAASLGQVYRARLKGEDQEVAVKIQRPNMLISVTLDLYIVRNLLLLGEKYVPSIAKECQSFILVVDNWAGRFVDELDYKMEVEHSNRFRANMDQMRSTLGDAILVPKSYDSLCSDKVLVTEWVEGNKLSAIDKVADAELSKSAKMELLKVLLNSYLVQLLETGFLHADPHPGNFLITKSGKLCILDYGLMTEVAEDKRYALLEYVAHLLSKDYAATLEDLVTLEFIPPEILADPEKREIVAPLLGQVLEQLSGGGGAASINVPEMGQQVEELAKQYPITIPAYFGLIVRAFGALEGIGLSIDPNYSITKDCFPYLAKRLLSDDSDRVRLALRTFLYGRNQQQLDLDRVEELASGYRQFTATAAEGTSGNAAFRQLGSDRQQSTASTDQTDSFTVQEGAKRKNVDPAIEQLLVDVIFSAQGNYVQELLVQEAVRISTALLRSVSWTFISGLVSPVERSGFPFPLTMGNFPFSSTSFSKLSSELDKNEEHGATNTAVISQPRQRRLIRSFVGPSEEDVQALRTLKRLLEMLAGLPPKSQTTLLEVDKSNSVSMGNSLKQPKASEGIIDRSDLILLRNAVRNILRTVESGAPGSTPNTRELLLTLQTMLPSLRKALPGAIQLSRRYTRSMLATSFQRLATGIEDRNKR